MLITIPHSPILAWSFPFAELILFTSRTYGSFWSLHRQLRVMLKITLMPVSSIYISKYYLPILNFLEEFVAVFSTIVYTFHYDLLLDSVWFRRLMSNVLHTLMVADRTSSYFLIKFTDKNAFIRISFKSSRCWVNSKNLSSLIEFSKLLFGSSGLGCLIRFWSPVIVAILTQRKDFLPKVY